MNERPSWDDVWMTVARSIAARSKCSRAQIGAVIVDAGQNVLSCSYNGPPPGFDTPTDSCRNWCPRAQPGAELDPGYESCPASHAEANGVARADTSRLSGATCYVTGACCRTCAKLLATAGVTRIVHQVRDTDAHRDPDGVESFLKACGVTVERV